MSDAVTTSVEVAVSPEVAFDVFVGEIDAWYRVDHDTLPDLTRTAAIRFEPCLGGRLLDVQDIASGEGRELARITVWEPGRRLAFTDNEGTEVDVRFERRGEGTRVTLTHRGLDRLAPNRAAALRRSGWAALTVLYRDHVAPNARPAALAAAFLWLPMAIALAVWIVVAPPSGWMLTAFLIFPCAIILVSRRIEWRLARRWVASDWSYQRIQHRVLGLSFLGLLVWNVHSVFTDDGDPAVIGLYVLLLLSWWLSELSGPAGGESLRNRRDPPRKTYLQRHPDTRVFLLIVGAIAATMSLTYALAGIDAQLADLTLALFITGAAVWSLRALIRTRRERKELGFNPDYYLAVDRRIGDGDRRPELLIHQPSKQPEYSGWYAYANERDEHPPELVAWSMKDLIEHSPEAAHPLREGHGKWRWDQHLGAYKPIDGRTEQPQPA